MALFSSPGEPDTFWELHRKLGERYEADMRQSGAITPSLFKRQARALGSKKARSMAQVSLEKLPPFDFRGIKKLEEQPPSPGSSSGLGTGSLSILPRRHATGEIGSPQEPPPVIERAESPCSETREPHGCWVQKSKSANISRRRSVQISKAGTTPTLTSSQQPVYTLNPTGNFRNFWDCMGILFLLKDSIAIPLQFILDDFFARFPLLFFATQVAVFYWAADILLSCATGYLHKGHLVSDLKKTSCRYLRTWFAPDVLLTATDAVLEFTSVGENVDETAISTKILRLTRLFRIVRLGKLTRVAIFLRDQLESSVASIQFSLLLVMLGMMLLEHVLACCWLGIGSLGSDAQTWLKHRGLEDSPFMVQYTASLRWAFMQLGVGGTEIEAVNQTEGMYTVAVCFISLVTFSTVISSMTSLVTALHSKRLEESQQFGLLRRFLRQERVPEGLGGRVTRFLQYAYHTTETKDHDLHILGLLSKPLQAELHFARYKRCLEKLPFLEALLNSSEMSVQESHVVQQVATDAMAVLDAGEDDVVFVAGAQAEACYCAMQGSLTYETEEGNLVDLEQCWVAEMCLWTPWSHVGDLTSATFSKVLAIQVEGFCACVARLGAVQVQAHFHAQAYVKALNEDSDVTDLWQFPEPDSQSETTPRLFSQLLATKWLPQTVHNKGQQVLPVVPATQSQGIVGKVQVG